MKMKLPVFLAVLLIFPFHIVNGQVTIHPGTFYTLSQLPADGGAAGDNGNTSFELISSFNIGTRTIRALARSRINPLAGTGISSSRIFYEFVVGSTPETTGDTVSSVISYLVDWDGHQAILTGGISNSLIVSEITLRDMTAGENIHVEKIHELDLETHRFKTVQFGRNFDDTGTKPGNFPAILKRGHIYRLTLRMESTVFLIAPPLSGSIVECNYNEEGFRWEKLAVKVGLDERELLQRLENFENHRHVYLTGRGEGHNNTEAISSSPVLVDDKQRETDHEQPRRPR